MAPQTTIPSATSVVDYLNTKKQDSSFSARKKLYTDLGFESRLGSFVGGANQNLALLKQLQRGDVDTPAPTPVPTPTPSVPGAVPTQNTASTPAFNLMQSAIGSTPKVGGTQTTTASDLLTSVGFKDIPAPAPNPAQMTIDQTRAPSTPSPTGSGMATPETSQAQDDSTRQAVGVSAADLYPDIFGEKPDMNEADYVNKYLNSAEGQLFLDRQEVKAMTNEAKAEALKQELDTKYQADVDTLTNELASNGLAFSGIRGSKVKALADSLAASELEIDRDLASKLLDADLDLREAILKGVAELAKDANEGRKEAIQQLNAIGYAVINGELVPTLSAQAGERAQKSLELSEQRLQLAEQAAAKGSSGNKLTLSEATSRNLPGYLVGTSEEEVANSFYDKEAPDWFARKVQEDNGKALPKETVQKLWEQQAPNYRSGVKESENHNKAAKYFGAFEGTSPDTVQGYATRVDFWINSGLSYAESLAKVQKEINDALKKAGEKKIDWKNPFK